MRSSDDAEPTDPLPPREDAEPASGWSGPVPPGAEPPAPPSSEDDEKPKPDRGRADWLPPEAPRGPGGL